MVEKLAKALEGLRNIQFTTAIEDTALRKKEKMLSCALVADQMVSLRFINAQNIPQLFSIVIESLIHLCDDKDSDVRMVADESLNRIIRGLTESNMFKVQVELLEEIKRNGPPRCLRAALWRFGQLNLYIRPDRGRRYAENLIPSIIEIMKREEESVHETLAMFVENTFKVLGVFIQDNDIKSLLKGFFQNLSSSNVVIRRTTAACINSIVRYCRKPHVFNSYILNTLLDRLVPVSEDYSSCLVLGVLGCLRMLLPNLSCDINDEGINGSFGLRQKKDETLLSMDRLIQIYELCMHYWKSKDHNVVTASLETLNQLLQSLPHELELLLLSPNGFNRSYIHSSRESKIRSRSGSEMSVAGSVSGGDETPLFDDSDLVSLDLHSSLVVPDINDSKQLSLRSNSKFELSDDEIKMVDNPFKDKLLGEIFEDQLSASVDSDAESLAPSEINASSLLMGMCLETKETPGKDYSRPNSREDFYSNVEDEIMDCEMNVDVGSFTDQDVPLNFCARYLAASFLLEGVSGSLKSDTSVRVSIKSLALSCVSAIVKLHPIILKLGLAKNNIEVHNQDMSDILLFADHPDPQIRGNVTFLITTFINSILVQSKGFECDWLEGENNCLNMDRLLEIVFKGLKDESSTCSRHVLYGLKNCLKSVLLSVRPEKVLPMLYHLPSLASSSYWLLKVKLVEILCELPFICLNDLTTSNFYQDEIIEMLFNFLGDEDSRVRVAAAESLTRIIPRLYYGNSTLLVFSREFTAQMRKCLKSRKEIFFTNKSMFPPFSYVGQHWDYDHDVEDSLSRIVAKLTNLLMVAVNKSFIFGCLEALKSLSKKYPPPLFLNGWNCSKSVSDSEDESYLPSNLITIILSLLVTSPVVLDLTALSNAMTVLGNLFAGHCICNMKSNYQVTLISPVGEAKKYWNILRNERLSLLAEHIFTHVMKVLNIYSHLLEEVPLSKATASATAAVNLLPLSLASPIKKQEKKPEKEEKVDERKQKTNNYSYCKQYPQYAKLYQLLKSAYSNYKVSLESSVSEKFVSFLESTINCLCILLEIGTVHDTGRCAEEILSYLKPAISVCASPSVLCVIQLLKSLFGTNLGANWENNKTGESEHFGCTLFANIYQIPSEFLFSRVSNHSISATLECENLAGSRRRTDRKVQNADRNCLATYIRLLEPMVIKSFQLYTFTNDVAFQSNVLHLLNQLMQLRVNYCLLDANEIFVGFVLKQFELIECGQIPGVEKLLPEIFQFLVLLSYNKHHSKTIMSIPKILQLCDGLMASNQSTQTHCIPALIPIVQDVFLSRNVVSPSEQKELETQREVVLSMLLRLAEFYEIMNMLALILRESRSLDEREKWKRWSRQIIDIILPLASQDRLRTETFEGQEAFNKLMSSLSPNVLRPIDPLLRSLFVEPNDYSCSLSLKRWLSRVTVITETILHVKEDVLLCRLEEVSPNINLSTFLPPRKFQPGDPFNVRSSYPKFEPSETFARFLLKVISVTGHKILEFISTSDHFQRQLSVFFLCVFHIVKSGTFHRVCSSLQTLLISEHDSMTQVCSVFLKMVNFAPMLSCQFTYFLALLNYFDHSYWKVILSESSTLATKLVQSCGVISMCDYLCEILSDTDTLRFLLTSNIKEVISLSNEIPIKELITTIHRRTESAFLIKAISSQSLEQNNPHFVEKLLRILEIAHNSHSGIVLSLLIKRFIISRYLALSRLASLLACRRVEFLLTLPPNEAHNHLDKNEFTSLIKFMDNEKLMKRHYTLVGLLRKLSVEIYDLPAIDLAFSQTIDAQTLKTVRLDEEWYSNQVKERCCQENYSGQEIASLLSVLRDDKIMEIMSCSNFNIEIVKNCLLFLDVARQKYILDSTADAEEYVNNALFDASKTLIFKSVQEILARMKSEESRLNATHVFSKSNVLGDETMCIRVWKLVPSLTVLMNIINSKKSDIEKDCVESVMNFQLLCLEILNGYDVEKLCNDKTNSMSLVNQEIYASGLKCCASIFRNRQISCFISRTHNRTKLTACVQNVFSLVKSLIPRTRLSQISVRTVSTNKQYAFDELHFMDSLLTLVLEGSYKYLLPSYLKDIIRDLIICICEIPGLSVHILKVPENYSMQEIETLENFISTISTVRWTSRQQFEEIWVGLLAVLGFSNQNIVSGEEHLLAVQASTAAVEGITILLKNTMVNPITKTILHHGRDSSAMKNVIDKLPFLVNLNSKDQFGDKSYHFLNNLEISNLTDRYQHGLLSVEYILNAVKQISNKIEMYDNHNNYISEIGLDLTSCVHLLMELFNQWIFQPSPDIRLVTSCLKSAIVISDLFTDIAQFQWLLDFCLRIEHVIITENTVILPLIILGCCKAISILLPDIEMCERIKRLMLYSRDIACRIATIQGLLYLLQSPVVASATSHCQKYRITMPMDETNFVVNIVDIFLPIAIDIIQNFRQESFPVNDEYERCSLSLMFYLLQHYHPQLREMKEEFLSFILQELSRRTCSECQILLLVRGIERLMLTSVIEESFKDQISKIALDMASQNSVTTSRCGLQLLLVLSFLEKRAKDIRMLVTGQEDPEKIMKDMEKINVLFEKLKKSYPEEAEIIGNVISYILLDFTASDVLTKVIQEFLSSQQPHLKILSGLLFKVFERAELSLLEAWVVFSLPSFIQGLPVSMSVWTLNCFFVSASNETWLRSMFPLVQSRMRMAEPEDKKLLCLAASNFYKQLKDEEQKKLFMETFKNAGKTHSLFGDLLAFL